MYIYYLATIGEAAETSMSTGNQVDILAKPSDASTLTDSVKSNMKAEKGPQKDDGMILAKLETMIDQEGGKRFLSSFLVS